MINFRRLPAVQLSTQNVATGSVRPGDLVSLNPQPLPPKEVDSFDRVGGRVSINPQPLPPRVSDLAVDHFQAALTKK